MKSKVDPFAVIFIAYIIAAITISIIGITLIPLNNDSKTRKAVETCGCGNLTCIAAVAENSFSLNTYNSLCE